MPAVLFDMDGVIIDSATVWKTKFAKGMWNEFFPTKIAKQVNSRIWFGHHLLEPFRYAVSLGFEGKAEDYRHWIHDQGLKVCATAPLSPNLLSLLSWLKSHSYSTAIVSSSSVDWVNIVVSRLKPHVFDLILSLDQHHNLKPKPDPSGYLYAMDYLHSTPNATFILEDSTTGIKAGIASGAHTIWYNRFFSDHADMPSGYLGPLSDFAELSGMLSNLLN